MKKDREVVVVRKKSCGWWSFIKALLIVAGLVFVVMKLYDKFFAGKTSAIAGKDTDDASAGDPEAEKSDAEEGFSASADDVIANPENME